MTRLRFISDVATPHVNALLAELKGRPGLSLELWFAGETFPGYPVWRQNPTHLVQQANIFGGKRPSLGLLARSVASRGSLAIVGWSNPSTRILLPLLDLTGRDFLFFSDEPAPSARSQLRSIVRNGYLRTLRRRAVVLATGRNAMGHFLRAGFSPDRVLNAPIPTVVPANLAELCARRPELRRKFNPNDKLLVVGGSQLIPLKGFDVLLAALAKLNESERGQLRLVIVGTGPELERLQRQRAEAGLQEVVHFEPWMELADFEALFAAADLAVHPARFDGYGATSLMAVAMGLPAIGTHSAGSAAELIEPDVNGFLYDAEDAEALAEHLRKFLANSGLARRMGAESTRLAPRWSPAHVADVFIEGLRRIGSTT